MLTLSFGQKTNIIEHLTDRSNWTNIFNLSFFTDKSRKWSRKEDGALKILTNDDKTKAKVIDESNGRSLLVERLRRGSIKVTDEFDRSFIIKNTMVGTKYGIVENVSPIKSSVEFGLEDPNVNSVVLQDLGVILRFHDNGSKTVFFEDVGHRVDILAEPKGAEFASAPGRFFHQVSLDKAAFEEWDIHPAFALIYSKLVVAKDLNIEPNLYAFNELDEDKAAEILAEYLKVEYDDTWEGPEQWRPKIKKEGPTDFSAAEKEWKDTTEFSGYSTGIPKRFFIEKTDDGFNLATASDTKNSIYSQGDILKTARNSDIFKIETINNNTTPQTILHFLGQAQTMTDHLDEEWSFIVLKSAAAKDVTIAAKDTMQNAFGLDYSSYAALNYGDDLSLLAMKTDILRNVKTRYEASIEVASMIEKKSSDTPHFKALIELGADYRYIDHDGAMEGKSFLDMIKKSGNKVLLSALMSIQGAKQSDYDDIKEHLAPELDTALTP